MLKCLPRDTKEARRLIVERNSGVETTDQGVYVVGGSKTDVVKLSEITFFGIVALKDGVAMGVIPGTLLGIREDLVSSLYLGEASGGVLGIAIVAVGVKFECLPSVCPLDPGRARLAGLGGRQGSRPLWATYSSSVAWRSTLKRS
jgi:hypothetical protein